MPDNKWKIPQQKTDWSFFPPSWTQQLTPGQYGQFMGASPLGQWFPTTKTTKGAGQVSPETLAAVWNYWQAQPRVSEGVTPSKSTGTKPTRPRIVSEQGYLFMVDTDKEGNEVWTPIGKVPTNEADWADYKTRMDAWSQQMEAAARASTQRGMEDVRPLLEEAFEAGRTARVSGLTGYGDWIKRWDAIHQINPYTVPQSERVAQRISQLEGQSGKEAELARAREDAYGIAWAEQERFLREGARPTAPPTPEWLPEFVSGLKAGQSISRQSIPTPSGQQLTKMSPSQAQALGGYAEWAGGSSWQDILAQAQMMQPFTPNIASRWQPARQRR